MKKRDKNYKNNVVLEGIKRIHPSKELATFISRYSSIGKRDKFLWGWCYLVAKNLSFSSVVVDKKRLYSTKVLFIMLVVLLDDSIDEEKDKKLFMILSDSMSNPFDIKISKAELSLLTGKRRQYFELAIDILRYLTVEFKSYPQFSQYKRLFEYDFRQMLNSMRYAELISENNYLMNSEEYFEYFSSNMQGKISGTIDLMASDRIKLSELGSIRSILYHSQIMARIGNWLSTWRRELKSRDFSSIVFPMAIEMGYIDIQHLRDGRTLSTEQEIIIKKSLLTTWKKHYSEISRIGKRIDGVDVGKFQKGLKGLLHLHLNSEGLK